MILSSLDLGLDPWQVVFILTSGLALSSFALSGSNLVLVHAYKLTYSYQSSNPSHFWNRAILYTPRHIARICKCPFGMYMIKLLTRIFLGIFFWWANDVRFPLSWIWLVQKNLEGNHQHRWSSAWDRWCCSHGLSSRFNSLVGSKFIFSFPHLSLKFLEFV